jgi:GntR family transcriptional regulator/MocR family aminotransferase
MFVNLDESSTLYRQIYEKIRSSVLEGRLCAGQRLPSTRSLAVELGVSRRTVLLAYQELLAEGFIVGKVGGGTYVAAELPDAPFSPIRAPKHRDADAARSGPRLSGFGRRVEDTFGRTIASWPVRPPTIRYDFHFGQPAVDWFPREVWRRLLNRCAKNPSIDLLGFSPPEGHPPLRAAVADYLYRARGVNCSADQVIIVSGSQQAIDFIARILLDPGDKVAIEEPHYHAARQIFLTAGAKLVPIPVDSDGLVVSKLEARGAGVRLLFTTPSHQFPTGVMMPLGRRLAMLQWANKENAYVLEDDYNSEFRYAGRPVAAIQGLDRSDRVIYVGTFSKALFPALRLGYIVAPPRLVPFFASAKFFATGYAPTLEQRVLADFIQEGGFDRHLRRVRGWAAVRKNTVLAAIAEYLGDRAVVSPSDGGLHLVVWFRDISRSEVPDLVKRAAKKGVGIYSIAPYYLRPPARGGLLLGYASMQEKDICEGIRILGTLV